jgi:hypothetical protein
MIDNTTGQRELKSTASAVHEHARYLEVRLRESQATIERLENKLADAVVRADERECELTSERELRRAVESAGDTTLVETLERMVARHMIALERERARLEDATICHEQAVI